MLQIGIVEDDKRRVPAELQRHSLELADLHRERPDMSPHPRRASERDQARNRVRRERIADFGDWADDDVEKTGRQSGLFIDLRNEESTSDGCIFRRLDADRISQGHCGGNRTVRQIQGEVPWADYADHPERLANSPGFLPDLLVR